jgi:outer membrane protein
VKRVGLLLIPILLAAQARADAAPRAITLAEAVELAQHNSPDVVGARGRTRSSEAETRSSYAAFLPNLTFSAGATRQLPAESDRTRIDNGQIVTIPDAPWSFSTGLGASLQLFDGGRRLFELRQAKAGLHAAEAEEHARQFGAALDAKREYFNVLAARESEAAARAQLDQAEQQFRASVLRVRAGSATRSDSLRSQIQLSTARLAVLEAQSATQVANASLTRVVGAREPVTASEADTLGAISLGVDDAELLRLVDDGPAVRQARAQLTAAQAGRQATRTGYLPSLSASYTYSGSGTDSRFGLGDDPFSYGGSLRFSLSLPLFNQLDREEQVIRADAAKESAEALLRDARLAAQQSLAQYLALFRTAEERVATQTATLQTAEEDLRVQDERYRLGVSTVLDVLTSHTQLNQAREALIRARYDQRVAKAQLEALVGRSL